LVSFLDLAKHSNIPLNAAKELLDGMLQDQQKTELKTEAELLRYCHAVAGTVGLMMCRILNCKQERADSFAIDLGIAMQLTNISRDVLEDAQMGRRYLPANWFEQKVTIEDIAQQSLQCKQPVSDAIARLLALSEQYYASALLGIRLLPFRSRFAIAIALRVYRQIGWVVRRNRFAWWKGRVMVGKTEKILLSFRSLTELLPRHVPDHKASLHKPLLGLAGVHCH
jgi:phytoene synthase